MRPGRTGSLAAIVKALGGELYDGGCRALVPGPGHSGADRSLSLLLSEGRVVAHSFAGDDWRAVLDDLRARGLIDGDHRPSNGASRVRGFPTMPAASARVAAAAALWSEARPIPGTAAERHLLARGVGRSVCAGLRFHPAAPQGVYRGRGPRRPALVAAIHDPNGRLAGVELTYLTWRGGLADLAIPRKTIGRRPPGAAVRLDPAGDELLVGEGVFTCLSASEALGLPAWALLAVGNLRAWSPPPGVRRVTIAADRGRAGLAGARVLAGRLRALGLGVQIRPPPRGHDDWNDWARAQVPAREL